MTASACIRLIALTALVAAVALPTTGCGIPDPYGQTSASTSTAPRVVDNELRPTHPYHDAVKPKAAAASPEQAIERFATLYINWTYRTLAEHRLELAQMAVGTAAAAQRRGAAESRRDDDLARGKVANRGELVAVARRHGAVAADYIVVTRETTTGTNMYDGLPPAYHVTLVTVQAVAGGWAVSAWEPQT